MPHFPVICAWQHPREGAKMQAASPDYLTKFLAAWGATLATFGLGWTLYRDLLDRAKLQVSVSVRRIAVGPEGTLLAVAPDVKVKATEELFVVMNVVNVGRRPAMWQGWGGKYHRPEVEANAFFIPGKNLPKMLGEGESHSEFAKLKANLWPPGDNVRRLYIWDPAGREWALSRKQLRQLKKEAREATR